MTQNVYCIFRKEESAVSVEPGVSSETVSSTTDKTFGDSPAKYRFKKASTDEELDQLSGKKFALNTDRKISWAVDLFVIGGRKECLIQSAQPRFCGVVWMTLS